MRKLIFRIFDTTYAMGHPLRDRDPSIFRLITIRTVRGEMWLTPEGKTKRLIGGILARYQEILGIEIYAYYVLANHIHLLIRAPEGNADEFAENINREISRRVNWRHRREGALWGKRYSEQQVLTEEDLVEALLYINTNSTRHGLLRDPSQWRGLHSYNHLLSGKDKLYTFTHYSRLSDEGVPLKTTHRLTLSTLPQFSKLSFPKRRKKLKALLESRLKELWDQRKGKSYLGQEAINRQTVGDTPMEMSRTSRPSCYSKCVKSIREFLEKRKLLLRSYAEASIQFRLGNLDTLFPAHTFLPPLHRKPRAGAFRELGILPQNICG